MIIENPTLDEMKKLNNGGYYWIRFENSDEFMIGQLYLTLFNGESYYDDWEKKDIYPQDSFEFSLCGSTHSDNALLAEVDTEEIKR